MSQPVNLYVTTTQSYPPSLPSRPMAHGLHFLITLLTCGLWLPIWLILAIADSVDRKRKARADAYQYWLWQQQKHTVQVTGNNNAQGIECPENVGENFSRNT